jgi:hypothetical protein
MTWEPKGWAPVRPIHAKSSKEKEINFKLLRKLAPVGVLLIIGFTAWLGAFIEYLWH